MAEYIFQEFNFSLLNTVFILKNSAGAIDTGVKGFYDFAPREIDLDNALFFVPSAGNKFFNVSVVQTGKTLILACNCVQETAKLCDHKAQVLFNILSRNELRLFFDREFRLEKIKQVALEYGLENEPDPEAFFACTYTHKDFQIVPRMKELFKLNKETDLYIKKNLLPGKVLPGLGKDDNSEDHKRIVVFRRHKYYKHFCVEMFEAARAKNGKIKNPLVSIDPLDLIWKIENPEQLKFYTAAAKFRNTYEAEQSDSDIEGLKALVKNPLGLDVFYHDDKISENIHTSSLVPVKLKALKLDIRLSVSLKGAFYEVSGKLYLQDKGYDLDLLNIKYHYFLLYNGTLQFIENPHFLKIIAFFKQYNGRIVLHESKFEIFRQDVLAQLEDQVQINYSYLKPATLKQLKEQNFDLENEKLIYLSESDDYVLITPVVRYGDIEVPVLSRKQIYAVDSQKKPFKVNRDEEMELQFLTMIVRQHAYFEEQLVQDHFHLHRKHFADSGWFLDAFEEWKKAGAAVLGFNKLKDNKLNPNKAKITIQVISGLDWFETGVDLRFGDQKVSLKNLHKSLRNKHNFVQLGDGTLGILPDEWIEKFSKYFNAAEVSEESLRTPKINFASITELYEDEVLSPGVKLELEMFKAKVTNFKDIEEVHVPEGLNGVLRDYQKRGLHWLNFLDEFGFGGCLADDMGLGKTIQVLAFILMQKEKGCRTNLIVVPTTLIFNWQAEIAKFAPSLRLLTVYGAERVKNTKDFELFDVVLTSYGTLLYDIRFLKEYTFNYIFFDESQTMKNPSSQRYQSAALLKSKSKIVLTGTPIENNTFDLYGQLSLACPGLLGNKQFFRDHYSSPIDKFKDSRRAVELQKKIKPFILRRTKKQVATELPEKTEMVLYCEMGVEQRMVYDSYKIEYRNFLMTKKEEDLSRYSMHILKGLTLLRQICDAPALLKGEAFYGDASSKIDVLMGEIEEKSGEHKILIFSQFVTMLDLIRKQLIEKGIAFEYLTGQTKDRASRVNDFQNNKEIRVFLVSLKAGGMGLNLTEADYVYLVDPWWNPAVENQAIDRSYRIGQQKNVVAVRLICPDTIEEKIMTLQKTKKDLVDDLIKTDEGILKQLSKQELLELFS